MESETVMTKALGRGDHMLVGVFVSMLLTIALTGIGAFLLLEGDSTGRRQMVPEALRLPGLVLMLFSGVVSAGVVAACRSHAVRRGFTRAAQGALWTGAVVAALNVALVALLAYARWRSYP
jgi:hypothetical protein